MKVYYDKTRETTELEFTGTAGELLKQLDINPETVVVTKNSTIITQDDEVSNDDEIKLLSVVSGG